MIGNTEFVDNLIPFYEETLKPLIGRGEYGLVHSLLDDAVIYIRLHTREILLSAPHALNISSQLISLHRETVSGGTPARGRAENLETFIAQYKMHQNVLTQSA